MPRLVLHVLHRFDTGGLENGVVNLLNHMPRDAFAHAVLALTEVNPIFKQRVQRSDVQFFELKKKPGHGAKLYPRFMSLLRELKPAVVHTRNLGPLEMQLAAALCRVPGRVHGEHGREVDDLDGSNRHLQRVRRLYAPFVHRWIALSADLETYLVSKVGIPGARIDRILNGVDDRKFRPASRPRSALPGCPFDPEVHWLVGTVGRMQAVKNQLLLARAFVRMLVLNPGLRARARLVLVGDGPMLAQCRAELEAAGVAELAWLPGERSDVAEVMRCLSLFVLPSLAEGISNTILEAMASGLPVLATQVGGNAELVMPGHTGWLVPSDDVDAMAHALAAAAQDEERAAGLGGVARAAVEQRFGMAAMVSAYAQVYDKVLARRA
jgi:sugar transferase (PEP-CTERM/EpsH1 system associated)